MLSYLRVRGLALLDDVTLEFSPGLNVLTGETGAGKSIIVDALALLRGGRGKSELVRSGDEAAVVDAQLELGESTNDRITALLTERGVSCGSLPELVLQRVLPSSGKGRSFVQAQLTTLGVLTEVGEQLIDICSQHEYHSLTRVTGHMELLDSYAGLGPDLALYGSSYGAYRQCMSAIETLRSRTGDAAQRADYLRFQLEELERVNPQRGELAAVERQVSLLRNAHGWAQYAAMLDERLSESEGSVLTTLGTLVERGRRGTSESAHLASIVEQLMVAQSACDEALRTAHRLSRELEVDPAELDVAEQRLHDLTRLRRKHGVEPDDLAAVAANLRNELQSLENLESRLRELEQQAEAAREQALRLAYALSEARVRAATGLGNALERELGALCMPSARLEARVELQAPEQLGPRGLDRVEFLFSANPGEPLAPLTRVASGGELSRVLLALKGTLAAGDQVSTYVFDEVDAGVGGAVAEAIGNRLSRAARHHQVLCITHLPQIAAFADAHFRVDKRSQAGRTVTRVARLDEAERIAEMARMLGGSRVSDTALQHARQLLEEARGPKRAAPARGASRRKPGAQ
ncbi:MAG: DNA repair protein RecN [Polyangiaceae bacterium]|nr:DNA repair protein RecN [Polyangiaceae bacterium]